MVSKKNANILVTNGIQNTKFLTHSNEEVRFLILEKAFAEGSSLWRKNTNKNFNKQTTEKMYKNITVVTIATIYD